MFQMVAQLIEQAFAQVAAGDSLRIELAHNFQRFVQIGAGEVYGRDSSGRGCRSGARCSRGCRSLARRAGQRSVGCLNLGCYLWANCWLSIRLNKRLCFGIFRRQLRAARVCCREVLGRKNGSFGVRSIEVRRFEGRSFGRLLGDSKPQRLRVTNDLGRSFHICLGSRDRSDSQQFFIAGNQISFFVQIPNDQLGGLVHRRPHRNRAQLP